MGQFLAEYLGEALVNRCSWLPEDLRAYHRGLLLRLLGEEGPMTRRDLAQRSALSLPTVASIVSELLIAGQITESIPRSDRVAPRGPRAGQLRLARHARRVLGVDLSTSRLRVGVCDLSGVVSEVVSIPVDPAGSPARLLDLAVNAARPLAGSRDGRLIGVGIGVPGPVDQAGRRSLLSLPLGWRDVPVAERFEEAFGVPAVVEYNVRAMALAEARHGRGPRCSCGGVGCLESVLGTTSLRQRIREAARQSPALRPLLRRRLPVLEVLDMAVQSGYEPAGEILDDVVEHLSTVLALSVDLLSPTRVALGGELATAPKDVLDRVQGQTRSRISHVLRDQVRIERSEIGRYPGVLGAGTVALDRLFYRDQPPLTPPGPGRRPRPPRPVRPLA